MRCPATTCSSRCCKPSRLEPGRVGPGPGPGQGSQPPRGPPDGLFYYADPGAPPCGPLPLSSLKPCVWKWVRVGRAWLRWGGPLATGTATQSAPRRWLLATPLPPPAPSSQLAICPGVWSTREEVGESLVGLNVLWVRGHPSFLSWKQKQKEVEWASSGSGDPPDGPGGKPSVL